MTLIEMARDMARTLLADPADELIEIWHRGDEWGWHRMGEPPFPPPGAELILQDRVQNSDTEPTANDVAIERYAHDIIVFCHEQTTPRFLSTPSEN